MIEFILWVLNYTLWTALVLGMFGMLMWITISLASLLADGYKNSVKWGLAKIIGYPFVTTYKIFYRLTHRPSPLQREIMQEEKEIKQLEKQKADMERLDRLKEKKERLFEEVKGDG